jgi:protein-ribulosamine 3-kinase
MDRKFVSDLLKSEIVRVVPLHGGDINKVYNVSTEVDSFVVKVNEASRYPKMFEQESRGLAALSASLFRIPEVKCVAEKNGNAYLIMEYISNGTSDSKTMIKTGEYLAQMHRNVTNASFGFAEDNYIGTLQQCNTMTKTWSEFFTAHRIIPLLKKAHDEKGIRFKGINEGLLSRHLDEYFPVNKPVLVHGDLWNGNSFADSFGQPVLIDPAVYYGIPEMDLGMTQLFGGFSSDFYNSYLENNPLDRNWTERTQLCNLYPLLVHVNLFGSGYTEQIQGIINRFFS